MSVFLTYPDSTYLSDLICRLSVMSAFKIMCIQYSLNVVIRQFISKIYRLYSKIFVYDKDSFQLLLRTENANAFITLLLRISVWDFSRYSVLQTFLIYANRVRIVQFKLQLVLKEKPRQ